MDTPKKKTYIVVARSHRDVLAWRHEHDVARYDVIALVRGEDARLLRGRLPDQVEIVELGIPVRHADAREIADAVATLRARG